MTESTCIVTGGAGFIGCAMSHRLVQMFDRVVAIDNLHPQIHPEVRRPARLAGSVTLIQADITRPETWDEVLADVHPRVIVHLAAETGTGQSLTEASRHAEVNVIGTAEMLDALHRRERLPERIILSSSRAVYGEGVWLNKATGKTIYPGQRTSEQLQSAAWDFAGLVPLPFAAATTQPHPTSVYGATKLAQEHMLRSWTNSFGIKLAVLRLQNVYGPGQSLFNAYTGIVCLFARLAREGKSIPIYEDGKMLRDFVYIEDVADALCTASAGAPSPAPAYDIGSGTPISVHDLARIIARFYNAPDPHISGAFRFGDVRHASCDIARSVADLGWKPQWTLAAGIETLCKWVDEQPRTQLARSAYDGSA